MREHVTQLVLARERVHQRQLRRPRIAEQDLDALLLQQLEEGALSGHDGHVCSPVRGGSVEEGTSFMLRAASNQLRYISSARMIAATA
jgi:hypothetical protein